MKSRFDSDFSFIVESRLKVDGSQSWCFRCPYLKVSVKREFNVHVLVKGHTAIKLRDLISSLFDSVPFKFPFPNGHSED